MVAAGLSRCLQDGSPGSTRDDDGTGSVTGGPRGPGPPPGRFLVSRDAPSAATDTGAAALTVTTVPASARTDATTPSAADPTSDRFVRRAGMLLAVGATSWSAAILAFGTNAGTVVGERANDGTGLVFQLGAFALVTAMARTGALGPTRGARVVLRVERVLLSLAMVWTVLHFVDYQWADETGWVIALDVFWPLSMLGMLVLGIKVFRARRWQGPLRSAPLIAETWAAFAIPAFAIGQATGYPEIGNLVAGLHLLVGYARLGYLMHRRPELTRS